MNNSVQEAFKYNRARKHIIIGGAVILLFITVISCVSSFTIYKGGFSDMPRFFQNLLALFAVVIVEGAFVWLLYGFTRAFSSFWERAIALGGMAFIVAVMLVNIVTHFMQVKSIPLSDFQMEWIDWGAVMVFIAVLLIVLFITLADPVIRLVRLELRYKGKQEEKILEAKTQGLDSEVIENAMAQRANIEADQLATRILKQPGALNAPAYGQATSPMPRRVGYQVEDDRLD